MKGMRKSELYVIFYLLQDKKHLTSTVREIASDLSMSVGSVFNTLKLLQEEGFLIENKGVRLLRKRSQLIDLWAKGYAEILKNKLLIARFTFISPIVRTNWQSIIMPGGLSWGGEPAVALQDGFLQPERWDIYTADNANALIATARMIPDPQGEIFVYKCFWSSEGTPLLVVYADLLATGDDRCREAAERIKSQI